MLGIIAQHRRRLFVLALLVGDVGVVLSSFYAADFVRFHLVSSALAIVHMPHELLWRAALLAVVAFLPALGAVGLYEVRRGWSSLELMFSMCVAAALGVTGFLALLYLSKEFFYSRLMVWIFGVLSWAGLVVTRQASKWILRACFRRDIGILRVVVVGDSLMARSLIAKTRANPHCGLRVVGRLLPWDGVGRTSGPGASQLLEAFTALQRARPQICLFAEPIQGRDEMISLLARCQEEGIRVWFATGLHEKFSPRVELKEIESIPVLVLGNLRLAKWERILKRSIDVAGATVLLVLAAPFLLYAALRIRKEIGRPLIFRQTRVGFQGKPFTILKLRAAGGGSGRAGAPSGAGTLFGDFLRSYSLDEIPQLWNVLRGEMSLVGPRPETPERVQRYNPWNRRRLQVKPGITGLAQIAGVRGEHDFDTKSRFDVRYLESQSLLLDLQILFRTPLVILRRRRGGRQVRHVREVLYARPPRGPALSPGRIGPAPAPQVLGRPRQPNRAATGGSGIPSGEGQL